MRMTKIAKGKRPVYLDNPQIDKLLAIVMALTGEVSVLHERHGLNWRGIRIA